MKKIILTSCIGLFLTGCGIQNNVSFITQQGSCPDGTQNAPYCMQITIQNNESGQNYINSSNYPLTNLNISVTGPSNLLFPTSPGSTYDPNSCLCSTMNPGQSCAFYIQLNGESMPVGSKQAINITASYTFNASLGNILGISTGGSSANASTTLYEVPSVLITSKLAQVESYNSIYLPGVSPPYYAESGADNTANSVTNDTVYGFLHVAGTQGVYYSGSGYYAGNISGESATLGAVSNVLIYGANLFAVSQASPMVYKTAISPISSYSWSPFANGLPNSMQNNVITSNNGNSIYLSPSAIPYVYLCQNVSSGSGCTVEGGSLQESGSIAPTVQALGYTTLGSLSNSTPLTGLVAGATNGLWVESGSSNSPTNGWVRAVNSSGQKINGNIMLISADAMGNLYIAESSGKFYQLSLNGSNQAVDFSGWTSSFQSKAVLPPTAMVVDNAGGQVFITDSNGTGFICPIPSGAITSANAQCSSVFNSGFGRSNPVRSLNIVTTLANQ